LPLNYKKIGTTEMEVLNIDALGRRRGGRRGEGVWTVVIEVAVSLL